MPSYLGSGHGLPRARSRPPAATLPIRHVESSASASICVLLKPCAISSGTYSSAGLRRRRVAHTNLRTASSLGFARPGGRSIPVKSRIARSTWARNDPGSGAGAPAPVSASIRASDTAAHSGRLRRGVGIFVMAASPWSDRGNDAASGGGRGIIRSAKADRPSGEVIETLA